MNVSEWLSLNRWFNCEFIESNVFFFFNEWNHNENIPLRFFIFTPYWEIPYKNRFLGQNEIQWRCILFVFCVLCEKFQKILSGEFSFLFFSTGAAAFALYLTHHNEIKRRLVCVSFFFCDGIYLSLPQPQCNWNANLENYK